VGSDAWSFRSVYFLLEVVYALDFGGILEIPSGISSTIGEFKMSKSATVLARVTIGWSNSFVIEATLETLAALRSARTIERAYLAHENVTYLSEREIGIEIIESAPTMTAAEYEAMRDAEKAAESTDA